MRAPIRTVLSTLVLSLAACVSGTRTIVVHDPAPTPPPPRPVAVMKPAPAPQTREALEVTLGRPMRGQIPIQTSRSAYVAIFEIIPNQGVTLVQPTATQRRRLTPAGVSAVGMWWAERRAATEAQPARFIYVVAADQPLRLSDQAYQSDYWQRALGATAYRGTNLYATMRAISRVVVPAVTEQDWAEDMLAIAPAYARQTPQQVPTARVYCPDGSVREVPMDFADRAICPMRVGSNDPGRLTRGDSAFSNGRRIDGRGPRDRGPVDRVGDDPHYGARNDPPRGNGRPTPLPSTPVTPPPANPAPITPAPVRPPRRDGPVVRPQPTPDDAHDAKRQEQEDKHDAKRQEQEEKRDARDERKDAKSAEHDAKKAEQEERKDAKKEEQTERKDARDEAKDVRNEAKDERKEAKPEPRDEPKSEPKAEKPDPKAESGPEAKPEPKAEPRDEPRDEPKPDQKAEQKDSSRDDKGEAKEEQKDDKQKDDKSQPEGDRRGPGRSSQGGKPKKN